MANELIATRAKPAGPEVTSFGVPPPFLGSALGLKGRPPTGIPRAQGLGDEKQTLYEPCAVFWRLGA